MGLFNERKVMTGAKRWERAGSKNACRLCGQYVQDGEEYYFIYHPTDLNFLVHADEWEQFKDGLKDEEVFEKLKEVKRPRPKNSSRLPEHEIEAFKMMLSEKRYRIRKETSNRIYFKTSKELAPFYFDKRFGTIEFTGNRNGLFDGLFLREIQSRLHEAWQKELGNQVKEGFRADKVISEAMTKVEEILG